MIPGMISLITIISSRDLILGGFVIFVIYTIGYFGVVFDLTFKICKNSCTYVFSKES